MKQILNNVFDDILKLGFVDFSISPWNSLVLRVQKCFGEYIALALIEGNWINLRSVTAVPS